MSEPILKQPIHAAHQGLNRFRNIYFILFGIVALVLYAAADPDNGFISNLPFGSSVIAMLVLLARLPVYAFALHLTRRALVDYLDLKTVMHKACETSTGAGLVALAVSVMMLSISILVMIAAG